MTALLHLNLHREFFAQIAAGTKRLPKADRPCRGWIHARALVAWVPPDCAP